MRGGMRSDGVFKGPVLRAVSGDGIHLYRALVIKCTCDHRPYRLPQPPALAVEARFGWKEHGRCFGADGYKNVVKVEVGVKQLHFTAVILMPQRKSGESNSRLILHEVLLKQFVGATVAAVQRAATAVFEQLHVLVHENVVKEASERMPQSNFGPKSVSAIVLRAGWMEGNYHEVEAAEVCDARCRHLLGRKKESLDETLYFHCTCSATDCW